MFDTATALDRAVQTTRAYLSDRSGTSLHYRLEDAAADAVTLAVTRYPLTVGRIALELGVAPLLVAVLVRDDKERVQALAMELRRAEDYAHRVAVILNA